MSEAMYNILKRLYEEGRATNHMLVNAVKKTWITEEQYKEITGLDYPNEE